MANYLAQQSSGYIFRLKVPRQNGSGELRFSLKTRDKLLATRRAADVALRIKEDIATMEQLTREQIRQLVSEYVQDSLTSIREYVVHRRTTTPDIHEARVEGLSLALLTLQEDLALNRLDSVQGEVDTILKKAGLGATPELRQELAHALLTASVRQTSLQLDAMRTGFVPVGRGQAPADVPSSPGPTVSEVFESWWQVQSKAWAKRTVVEYSQMRKVVEAELGSRPVADLKPVHIEALGKNLRAQGLSAKSAGRYVVMVGTVLKYAVKLDLVPKNVAAGMAPPEPKGSAQDERDAFCPADLGALFGPGWRALRDKAPAKFWVPLLALYTGCRLEELCQLYTDDVQVLDGVPCVVVQATRPDQSVKTGEKRVVPLHPVLLGEGFLEYVEAQGDGRVFPKLSRVNHRYGHGLGKWFGDFKKKAGIDSPKKVFHSFRHTVITKLKEAGVEDSLVAELLGHKMQGQTFGRYAKASGPRVLLERVVKKLDFEL
jgi:integrase